MEKFIRPKENRYQLSFLRETLDESLPKDHPVRSINSIIQLFDFSAWENEYPGGGRPAYPPDKMCSLLIYGNMIGIRSSRKLEYACANNRDFTWLMEGLAPDHDTIADFRRRYGYRFKDIFRQTVKIGLEARLISMRSLAMDGTRILSNSSRWKTKSRKDLDKLMKSLDARIEEILKECEKEDIREDDLFGKGQSPNRVTGKVKNLKEQKEILEKAYKRVIEKEERAKKQRRESNKKRVPATDPDSDVMKCKRGGFSPNYNAQLVVDCDSGMIVGQDVSDRHTDEKHLPELYEQVIDNTGKQAGQILADSCYSTSENLEYLDKAGVDACMPPFHTSYDKNSSKDYSKDWPSEVPKKAVNRHGEVVDGTAIAQNSDKKFDKSAFKYDHETDSYICPMGYELTRLGKWSERKDNKSRYRYRCKACRDCPFKKMCSIAQNRSLVRTDDAVWQERQRKIMDDPERQKHYRLRSQTVEPVFGIIKTIQALQQFLLRGLEMVQIEWDIAVTAHNVRKLINYDVVMIKN